MPLPKLPRLFIISLLLLLPFPTLYIFRTMDDNRLTSWRWVFDGVDVANIFLILTLGILLALVFSKVSFPERHPATFLLLVSFAMAAPFWKEPEIILDSSRYFTQAKHIEIYGIEYFFKEWGKGITAWTDMPAVPFLYGLIFKFFGECRTYIQVFTTVLFSTTVVLTYKIGKTLWDEDMGYHAGLLLLGIPYTLTQVPLMLVDIPTMFFLTLSIYVFLRAQNQGGVRLMILSASAISLALLSKYSMFMTLSVLLVTSISMTCQGPNSEPRSTLRRGSVVIAIVALLTGAICLYKFDVFSEQIRLLMTYQVPGLRRWGESFVSTFFFQIHPLITASAVYSFYVAFKQRDSKYPIISYLTVLIFLLQIKRIRYMIMMLPTVALMASYGLQEIRDKQIRRLVVSGIVVSSLVVGIFVYLPFVQKISSINLKHAGEFLDSVDEEHVEVFVMPQEQVAVNPAVLVPILDLFTKKTISYHHDAGVSPPWERIEKSPLRFTWEYKNPRYYAITDKDSAKAAVVISSDAGLPLSGYIARRMSEHRKLKVFRTSEGVFQYKIVVTVYYD
ncbi:MAG: glycosyltransferase family 39 protein [Acidobacteria bacterium]|nr:glycosyltransferase family 39 protein [Acidobacteriota bacterium]